VAVQYELEEANCIQAASQRRKTGLARWSRGAVRMEIIFRGSSALEDGLKEVTLRGLIALKED
jgi:hypothetical protein